MSESVDASTQASLPLVAESVFKQYPGRIWANRGISLTIGPSEILGLLGPNGSGKTSFVRQITTETSITSRQIRVFGVDVESDPTRVKYFMGVVPQDWQPKMGECGPLYSSLYLNPLSFGRVS